MATDLLEKNELTATSRLGGMKRFIDDKYVNYTGGDDFYNLFGSRKKKKTKARQDVVNKYNALPTDCSNIQTSIDSVKNDLETLVKRAGNKPKLEIREQIDETNVILGELKSMQIKQGCQKAESAAQSEQSAKETLGILQSLGDTQVEKSKSDIAATKDGGIKDMLSGLFGGQKQGTTDMVSGETKPAQSNTKKILMYSGIALGAVLLIAVVVKMTKK
jgi:hypothetical protein